MIDVSIYADEKYPSYYISEGKSDSKYDYNASISEDVWESWKKFQEEEDKWDEFWHKLYTAERNK